MANAYFYSNIASPTTLSGNINNSVTSCTVASTTGWPGSTPYIVALDYGTANEELVRVTVNAAGTLTMSRAFGGTSAVSHSTGAAVRHVYNAQDATDFRTHEGGASGVHGVAGALVGTTDTQTLTNKTLTSPAISGAVMSGGGSMTGTFSGTPTFSGAVVFSGTPSLNNGAALTGTFSGNPTFSGTPNITGGLQLTGTSLLVERTLVTDNAYRARITSDTNSRFLINADGKMIWGTGATTGDTNLYRTGTNILATDDSFYATGTIGAQPTDTALDALNANLPTGTTGDLLNLRVNAAIQAAMGSDGAFRIYGGNVPGSWTPAVTNGGSVTWTTRSGFYWKIGKMVLFYLYLQVNAAGTGTGNVLIGLPSTPDRTIRQTATVNFEANPTYTGTANAVVFLGGSGANFDRIRTLDGGSITGADLGASAIITIQGWYREA